jgi:ribokinase
MKPRSEANTVASSVIAVIGGMTMDLVFEALHMPEPGESLDASSLVYKPGGKGSNTSVAIYRAQHNKPINKLSDKPVEKASATSNEMRVNGSAMNDEDEKIEVGVFLNTAIGDDAFGRQLKKNLQSNGVDVSGVQTFSNEMTGVCAVFVEEFTRESRDIGYPGANTKWVPRYQDSVKCLAGGHTPDLIVCHLETKRETIEKILQIAAKNGVDTLLNPSPVAYLPTTIYKNVTHLVLNEREAAKLSGMYETELENLDGWENAAKFFLDAGVKNFVITLGAKGAYYATEDSDGLVPAVKDVIVKDSTGAG